MSAFDEESPPRVLALAGPSGMPLRLLLYAFATALATETLVRGASRGWFEAIGAEGGPIEYAHYALCAGASVLFACASGRSRLRDVFALAAYGAALGVIREADAFLDKLAFHGAYKVPAALLGGFGLRRVYRSRTSLLSQFSHWMATPSFAVTASGVFVVLVYAQIVGQKELWQALMGVSYLRPVKDVAEEMQELIGYYFIFFGALESYLSSRAFGATEIIEAKRGLT